LSYSAPAARPTVRANRHFYIGAISKFAVSTVEESSMLQYAVVFFVIALIAALFGFTGIAAGAAGIAQTLFVVFLILAVIAFLVNVFRGRT
jgi:uncharacterized membrane protein YtjA (UPF0391 family)